MPNGTQRGNNRDRKRRRQWLLRTFGDGIHAPCIWCGKVLDASTLTIDRIVPGKAGGRYTRDNIWPACLRCNSRRGARELPAAAAYAWKDVRRVPEQYEAGAVPRATVLDAPSPEADGAPAGGQGIPAGTRLRAHPGAFRADLERPGPALCRLSPCRTQSMCGPRPPVLPREGLLWQVRSGPAL